TTADRASGFADNPLCGNSGALGLRDRPMPARTSGASFLVFLSLEFSAPRIFCLSGHALAGDDDDGAIGLDLDASASDVDARRLRLLDHAGERRQSLAGGRALGGYQRPPSPWWGAEQPHRHGGGARDAVSIPVGARIDDDATAAARARRGPCGNCRVGPGAPP